MGADAGMAALRSFLDMGGYAGFVWSAFGLSAAVLAGLAFASARALKRNERALAKLADDAAPAPGRSADHATA